MSNSFTQIPVWQGFESNWTYNHRLNRLGSFIYQDSVFSTAATGTGRDSGFFSTHYMMIPESGLQHGEIHLYKRIEAREKEMVQLQIDTMIPTSFRHSIFYLNGFDIIANNDADKIQHLEFSVKSVKGDYDTTLVRIQVNLMFNCQSIECDWINNHVDYDLNLYIGYIYFANEDYISYSKQDLLNQMTEWSRKVAVGKSCTVTDHEVPQFITDIKFSLNKAHWYVAMQACIDEENNPCMNFMQYKPKMKKNAYYKPHAIWSKKSKGTADMEIRGITVSKPSHLTMEHRIFSGAIIWRGKNKTAFSRDAVRSKYLFE